MKKTYDEESLAMFDLLMKPKLERPDIERVKKVAVALLKKLKEGELTVDQWRDKEATRDAVKIEIRDFLWSDETGLPGNSYAQDEVETKTADAFRHIYRVYPQIPSPFYGGVAA